MSEKYAAKATEYGFIVSTAEEPSLANGTQYVGGSINEEHHFFIKLNDLNEKTKYFYKAYRKEGESSIVVDHILTLEPEDDAAVAKYGEFNEGWRTPTEEEWIELKKNCTWTWTRRHGVNGRLVTATNGNSIFLPAAGHMEGNSHDYAGKELFYWSSSLYSGVPNFAYCVKLNYTDEVAHFVHSPKMEHDMRFIGAPVRAVTAQ
ncbi:MAG: hypothetical protein IJ651_07190 [Bacteroidales bacterium]|nr:hypothetical protein [Bacteroidales bacterium]